MAHRQEEKARRRREREEAERRAAAEARRQRRLRILGGSILAVIAVAVVAVVVAASGGKGGSSKVSSSAVKTAASAAGCTVLDYPKGRNDRTHTTGKVNYKTNPPSYGPHNPVPAQDGDYVGRTTPAKEHLVHALEHGRIEVQYSKSASKATISALERLFNQHSKYMLLFQNETKMPYQVAAVAWTHILGCPKYDSRVPAAIAKFRDAYTLKGPEYIPSPE